MDVLNELGDALANLDDLPRIGLALALVVIAALISRWQQAARISDFSGYMLLGEMIEFGATSGIFTAPADPRTQDYVSGRYG